MFNLLIVFSYNDLLSLSTLDHIDKNRWNDPLQSYLPNGKQVVSIMQRYIKSINSLTEANWERIILECSKIQLTTAKYPLAEFLRELGKKKPLFVIDLLGKYELELNDYLICIFHGLLASKEKKLTKSLLRTWINQSKYLESLAEIYKLNTSFLRLIYNKARSTNNFQLLTQILKKTYHKEANKPLILPIIDVLTKAKIQLSSSVLYSSIEALDDVHLDKILDNLLCSEQLDLDGTYLYHIEKIARRRPSIIIPFFKQVSKSDLLLARQTGYNIGECLVDQLDNRVTAGLLDPDLFSFLFDIKNKKVQSFLTNLVNSANFSEVVSVVNFLECYGKRVLTVNDNIKEILDIIRLLVTNHILNESILIKLGNIITGQSGVIWGDFGSSEAYRVRKEIIEGWKVRPDNNLRLEEFIGQVTTKLEKMIKQKRSAEEPAVLCAY